MGSIISDEVWSAVQPLLPSRSSGRGSRLGGRPATSDRAILAGILFVLRNRLAWTMLPTELGYGSGITCWRRLRQWQVDGHWDRIRPVLLAMLPQLCDINWERTASIPAPSRAATRQEHTGIGPGSGKAGASCATSL